MTYNQRVSVPTLFIASTGDPMVAPAGVRWTKDWVTGPYRLITLTGIGHFIPEVAPEPTTTTELLRHLRTTRTRDAPGSKRR